MNSVFIESNRIIAESQLNRGETESLTQSSGEHTGTTNNASWTTTIDTGIELKPGDQISMEACALNLNGAGSGNFQQFNGTVDIADPTGSFRKDNAVNIEIAYYVSNNCEFNFPLPSGKHMIEVNDTWQGPFGMPCLNGRHLWRPTYPIFTGDTLKTSGIPIGPGGVGGDALVKFSLDAVASYNGPSSNRQDNGGYFFQGMDVNTFQVSMTSGAGWNLPSIQPAFSTAQGDVCAYVGWLAQTCFQGNTGVQFGQPIGPVMPLTTAPNFDASVPDTTLSTLNLNVNIRNQYTNSGYFPNGLNGGANPLLCLNDLILVRPAIPSFPGGLPATGLGCFNLDQWATTGPSSYNYEYQQEPAVWKGGWQNKLPNGDKLYIPRKDKLDPPDPRIFTSTFSGVNCRGPVYDIDFNYLVSLDTPAVGDPDMGGMVNYNRDNVSIEDQYKRATTWWDFQTETIEIELQTGNIAPTRISEIITETFKARHGNADEPIEKFTTQRIYIPRGESQKDKTAGNMKEKEIGGISSKTYSTFTTLQGECLTAAQKISSQVLDNLWGWDALNLENIPLLQTILPTATDYIGKNFKESQAKMKYWSNMLCGNPYAWRGVTKLLPLIQYRPFISIAVGANFNH